jgi:hypothetical protein
MLHINYFGMTCVVDRATNIVLSSHHSNEIAKFVTCSILDTAAHQIPNHRLSAINKEWFTEKCWIKHVDRNGFVEYVDPLTPDLISKRKKALLRSKGYYVLLEQATIVGCSYDDLSDLSTHDLPMYNANKEQYINEFSICMNVSKDIARKHLDFLAESLMTAHFRKQTLIWKYGATLKTVETDEDYAMWLETVLRETVGLGQV